MRMRFVAPLAMTLLGLLLPAFGQETPSRPDARSRSLTRTYPVADLLVSLSGTAGEGAHPAPRNATCAEKEAGCTQQAQAASCPAPTSACPTPCSPLAGCAPCKECMANTTLEARLVRLITSAIQPQQWSCNGGVATLEYSPLGMALIVKAPPAVQEQVAELLQALRRLQDLSVVLDIRVVAMAEGALERVGIQLQPDGPERRGIDFNAGAKGQPPAREGSGTLQAAFLNEQQAARFLDALQGDPRTTVCQSPRLTVHNGQTATLQIGDQHSFVTGVERTQADRQVVAVPRTEIVETGLTMRVQPAVSADHKFVQLKLHVRLRSLAPAKVPLKPVTTMVTPVFEGGAQGVPVPFTQYLQQPRITTLSVDKLLCVPAGGTVVLGGLKRPRVAEQECAVPGLAGMPYLNRLFKTTPCCQERETVVLLITPRVVIQKERETRRLPVKIAQPLVPPPVRLPDHLVKPAGYLVQGAKPAQHDSTSFRARQVAKLVEMYHEACAGGHQEEARKLAAFALELDPACFSKPRR